VTQYVVYGTDRPGSGELKGRLTPEHWDFMDTYAAELVARGPSLTEDREETTGSLHIVDLPDGEALRAFAYDEPYYLGGVIEAVELYRFENRSGRTMWEFATADPSSSRYLVRTQDEPRELGSPQVILYGELSDLDSGEQRGRLALVEAPDAAAAAELTGAELDDVQPWEFGGRR
jgi:uncharacterized protein YciI